MASVVGVDINLDVVLTKLIFSLLVLLSFKLLPMSQVLQFLWDALPF